MKKKKIFLLLHRAAHLHYSHWSVRTWRRKPLHLSETSLEHRHGREGEKEEDQEERSTLNHAFELVTTRSDRRARFPASVT